MKKIIALIILGLLVLPVQAQQRMDQKFTLAQGYEQMGDYESAVKLYE
jgi:hypothetical protein